MVLLDDDIYQDTRELVLGKREKSQLLNELSDWFMKTYSVRILSFQFDKLKSPTTNRYRLYVIVESKEDYQKMYLDVFQPNEEYQNQISRKFRQLALKHRYADEAKLENLFVTFNDFSHEAMTAANWKAIKEAKEYIKNKYSEVWDVVAMFSSSVVFYYSDSDIKDNETIGVSKKIVDDYYMILKEYDEFNYYSMGNMIIKFDSKENLDKNYQGNLFYYSR